MMCSSGIHIKNAENFINNFLKKFEYNYEIQKSNLEYMNEMVFAENNIK